MSRFAVVCACAAAFSCARVDDDDDEPTPEYVEFTRPHTALDIDLHSDLRDGRAFAIDGVVREPLEQDLELPQLGRGGDGVLDLAEGFAIEGEAGTALLSIVHETGDGGREILYRPATGTRLRGTIRLANTFGSQYVAILSDDEGVSFYGAELLDVELGVETPATVAQAEDDAGEVVPDRCGHRREMQLSFACTDTHLLKVGESAEFCGLQFTNHSAWTVNDDWECTDALSPTIWSAVRP